jgi:ribosomal protein L7/L12
MAQSATTKSEVLEKEYEAGVWRLILAGVVLVVSLLCFWGVKLIIGAKLPDTASQNTILRPLLLLLGVVGTVGALALAGTGASRMKKAKERPTIAVNCPYCGFHNQFVDEPTSDYDCEGCHRRVYYENGVPVEIKQITCTFCKTVHKVSSKATHFMCDRCNRALRLTDPNDPTAVVTEQSEMLVNYDVQLTDPGRNKNEVAMALQSILVCNLPEARRQMEALPLTVMRNVPERKADAVRRRLRDLGATAIVTPTTASEQARAGRP